MNPRMETSGQVLIIPIEDIIPNRFQPRLAFDEAGLRELASSIKEHGIIQPLILRRLNDKYEIIAGERRYKAARLAGLSSVPGIVAEMDDKKSAEVAIVENVQRRDLSSIEEAKSYKALLDKGYLTQEELAKKMGLSQSAVANKLRLLSLAPSVQDALMTGKISERHARSLLVLDNPSDQEKWLNIIIDERLTVKELDRRLSKEKSNNNDSMEIKPSIDGDKMVNEESVTIPKEDSNNTFMNFINEQLNSSVNSINEDNDTIEDPINATNSNASNINVTDVKATNIKASDEEIEMLDFDIDSNKKDMQKVDNLINELVNNLKSDNYQVAFTKNDNGDVIKFEIMVNKD